MAGADPIRTKKQLSNCCVLIGFGLMALGLVASATDLAPELVATFIGVVGFAMLMYGVHVGWQIFYEREPEGPSS